MAEITVTVPTAPAITDIPYGSQSSSQLVDTNFDNLAATVNGLRAHSSEVETFTEENRTWLDATIAYTKINPKLVWETTTKVSFTADAIGVSNAGGSRVIEAVGLAAIDDFDTLAAVADTGYGVWLLTQSDGSNAAGYFSLETTGAAVISNVGGLYTSGYARRVGWVLFGHSTTIEKFTDDGMGHVIIRSTEAGGDNPGWEAFTAASESASLATLLPADCDLVDLNFVASITMDDHKHGKLNVYLLYASGDTANNGNLVLRVDFPNWLYPGSAYTTGWTSNQVKATLTATGTYFIGVDATDTTANNITGSLVGWYDNW